MHNLRFMGKLHNRSVESSDRSDTCGFSNRMRRKIYYVAQLVSCGKNKNTNLSILLCASVKSKRLDKRAWINVTSLTVEHQGKQLLQVTDRRLG